MLRSLFALALASTLARSSQAQQEQQPIGTIAMRDALVTGGLQVQGEQAKLLTSASVTAHNRTAPIELTRGGNVLICSTSRFHILRSGKESSLIFALDRGAIEIHSDSQPQDVIMTPDLRMSFVSAGHLDLRLRVTPNGDTCVENTGRAAPQISVSDAFTDSSYHLRPGQHVMFQHGSLHEIVDREQSSCGCPPDVTLPINTAKGSSASPDEVAARNPFPVAVSQGLVPEAKPVTAAVSDTEASTALTYSSKAEEGPPASETPQPTVAPPSPLWTAPPPSPPGVHDLVHAIGRFFHRLFRGRSQEAKARPAPAG